MINLIYWLCHLIEWFENFKKVLRGEYSGYKQRIIRPYPMIGPYLNIIDQWLKDDKQRPKKQRHTAARVFNRLKQEYEFEGAETTIRRYVREVKLRLSAIVLC